MNKTYNHAFSLNFDVEHSHYKDSDECLKFELDKVRKALARAVKKQRKVKLSYLECWDSVEEKANE